MGLVICGSFTAFMSSPINMLTCVMGQTIAGIPEYSGAGLRTIVTVINLVIVSAFQIYIKMNTGEDGIVKSFLSLLGACLFIIGASIVLPAFFGYRI